VGCGVLSLGCGVSLGGDRAVVMSVGVGIVHINFGDRSRVVKGFTLEALMERLAVGTGRGMAMSARKVKKSRDIFLLILAMMLPIAVVTAPASNAAGDCGFGYYAAEYDDYGDPVCEKSSWDIEETNDGFDRLVYSSIPVDNSDISNDPYDFKLFLRCTSKKLEVFGSSTYEIFFDTAYRSGGPVQVKFDSGRVVNYKFTKSTNNKGFFLNNPKTFSTSLSKAKNKVAMKFSSSRGIVVLQFPVVDFAQSKKTFSSAGCKF
jgi:hypothetical protein